jgi:hypothetical protein
MKVQQLHLFPQAELTRLRETIEEVEMVLLEQGADPLEGPPGFRVQELCRKLRDWQNQTEEDSSKLLSDQTRLLDALDALTPEDALFRIHWLVDLEKIAGSCVDNAQKSAELIIRLRTHLATAPGK